MENVLFDNHPASGTPLSKSGEFFVIPTLPLPKGKVNECLIFRLDNNSKENVLFDNHPSAAADPIFEKEGSLAKLRVLYINIKSRP